MKLVAVAVVVAVSVAAGVVGAVWATGGLDPQARQAGVFPEGVYRYHLTKKEVLEQLPTIEPHLLEDAVGTFTWTIRDGKISLHQTDCRCSFTDVSAPYEATAQLFTVRWPTRAANGAAFCSDGCVETVAWRFDGQALHITTAADAGNDFVFWGAAKPWVKID